METGKEKWGQLQIYQGMSQNSSLKPLILGANSMVGWTLFSKLPRAVGTCSPSTRNYEKYGFVPLDVTDPSAVLSLIKEHQPDLIIHCAAICKVEKCQAYPDFAYRVNVLGTENVLRATPSTTRLVYGSSDHVFGHGLRPFCEHSEPSPISYYGETRIQGERLVSNLRPDALIVRLPLCIGPSYNGRSGHLDWLKYRHHKGLPMTVVLDEYRSVAWTQDAAQRVWQLARSEISGLRHIWGDRPVSRPALAQRLIEMHRWPIELRYQTRTQRSAPHLGRVELSSSYQDPLAAPLPSVLAD